MKDKLRASLPTKRFEHSIGVCDTAVEIASRYGADKEKAAIAGLLHDCARKIPTREFVDKAAELGIPVDEIERNQPILLHAKLGVYYAREDFGVEDPEILDAIRWHTTGAPHMSLLAKVIYLADLVEPHRDFATVGAMRQMVREGLDKAMIAAYANTMDYLLAQHLLIHPDCLEGYNELVLAGKQQKKE